MKPVSEVKILIVEDDPFFMRVLHRRITSEGYQVSTAVDGRQGMKAIVTFEPDLVVSDWMMPEVDGLELCQSVKTGLREAAPYFILLTAKGEISDKLLGLETGADDYLTKPCDQGELMARVRAGVRIVTLTQNLRRTSADLQMTLAELVAVRTTTESEGESLAVCPGCRRVSASAGPWQDLDQWLAGPGAADAWKRLCPDCATRRSLESGGGLNDAA